MTGIMYKHITLLGIPKTHYFLSPSGLLGGEGPSLPAASAAPKGIESHGLIYFWAG